jgi:hypothetical protein
MEQSSNKLDERHQLIHSLRGQHLRIPDLHDLFQAWPEATSPYIANLRTDVDQTLNKYEHFHFDALDEPRHPLPC